MNLTPTQIYPYSPTNLQKFIMSTLDDAKDVSKQFIAVLYDP